MLCTCLLLKAREQTTNGTRAGLNTANSEIFISLRLHSMVEKERQLIHPAALTAGTFLSGHFLDFNDCSLCPKMGEFSSGPTWGPAERRLRTHRAEAPSLSTSSPGSLFVPGLHKPLLLRQRLQHVWGVVGARTGQCPVFWALDATLSIYSVSQKPEEELARWLSR